MTHLTTERRSFLHKLCGTDKITIKILNSCAMSIDIELRTDDKNQKKISLAKILLSFRKYENHKNLHLVNFALYFIIL